jgi:DNA-binding NarL/FixJ family response regulator
VLVESIALVADDPLVREALRSSLSDVGLRVLDAGAPETPSAFVWDFEPEQAAELHAATAEAPVLALVDDDARGRAAWRAGASGVMRREGSGEQIRAAVEAIVQGLRVFDVEMTESFGLAAPADPQLAPQLTPRETEVLGHLAGGLSNREIGEAMGLSPHTAKFHVASILDKLGAETRTEAVVLAARWGLLLL